MNVWLVTEEVSYESIIVVAIYTNPQSAAAHVRAAEATPHPADVFYEATKFNVKHTFVGLS